MKFAFFMQSDPQSAGRAHVSSVMVQLFERLRSAGIQVELIVAEDQCWSIAAIRPHHALYVLKSKSPLTLSIATVLAQRGATVVNPPEACRLARDKIATEVALARRGLPVPAAWATGGAAQLRPLLNDGAIWVKDRSGSKGKGVCKFTETHCLTNIKDPADPYGLPLPLFAQRDVGNGDRDLKVYCVGEHCWAITRPWPAVTTEDKLGRSVVLDDKTRQLALAAGRAMGLSIFGVDFLFRDGEAQIVDVNAFPGFKGIDEAPSAIAQFLAVQAGAS